MTSQSMLWERLNQKVAATAPLAGALVVLVLAILVPIFAGRSVVQDLFFILTMLSLAQCWNLLAGFGGLISVGQQAFVGVGAYAMFAAVCLYGVDPVPAILLSGGAAFALALPIAFLAFRLEGAYFSIGTWVMAEVARLAVSQWKALGGGTGSSLPREAVSDLLFAGHIAALLNIRDSAARDILAYWLALVLAIGTVGFIYWLMRSKFGLALTAIRDNADAARSVGINVGSMKWFVFLASAFGTGLAGGLIYMQKARISPDAAFNVTDWSAYVIFVVVIGGIGTIEGPIVGVLCLYVLQSMLAEYGAWYLIVLGLIGIVVMLFAPAGLWSVISNRCSLRIFPLRRQLLIKGNLRVGQNG